jgi:hypothetical protein
MKSIFFWDMMPCSPLSCARRSGGTYRLHLQGRRNRFSRLARWFDEPISTPVMLAAIRTTEPSGETQRTARHHIPEDDTLQCEYRNLVHMKSSIFWDITQCSPLKFNRRLEGTCRLHLQSSISYLLHAGFLLGLFFDPEDRGNIFLPKVG